jgi:O-antigen ligase
MLPFDRFYSEIILISYTAHTIIHLNKNKVKSIFSFQTLILSSVFFVNLIGTIYSPDKKEAFNDLERQLALLLFPILIPASGINLALYRNALLKVFGVTCVIAIIYLFIYALRVILYNHLPFSYLFSTFLTNHNFSAPIGMHATYMSMYVSLSLISFIFFFLNEKGRNRKILYGMCILILMAGLIQLASRSVFLATLFTLVFLFPFFIRRGINRMKFVMITLPVIFAALIGIYRINWLRQRYIVELKNDLTQASINNDILEPRIARWRIAWKLYQQAPLIGYGSGAEKKLLMEEYFRQRLYNSYLNKLNAHNQYLSMMLKTGILGLLIFLCALTYGCLKAWQNRDILFAGFMMLIAFVSFSENILDVNKTIFFYSFFFSFFIYSTREMPPLKPFLNFKKEKRSSEKINSF